MTLNMGIFDRSLRAFVTAPTRMRRRVIGVALVGVGVLAARALAPRLHARLMAGCDRMFEQMPDAFPPKRMMRGIEEIRANSARTLALLEAREHEVGVEALRETSPSIEERELAAVGAGVFESDALGR